MAACTPSTLWAARLFAITMSPGWKVGTRICSTSARKLAPVHRAIQDPGRGESRHPQRGDEGAALPSTVGGVVGDPLAAKSAPIPSEEIGGDPALIQKDEVGRVEGRGGRCPLRTRGRDVGAVVCGRA